MRKSFTLSVFCLFISFAFGQTVSIIPQNSSWKYLANGSNQGTAWRATSFNDNSWSTGNAEFGYGDGGEATVVSYGSSSSNKHRTTYFRKSFSVTNPTSYLNFTLGLLRDDGAVVYLNGVEVVRSNMPSGTIGYRTFASSGISGSGETTFYTFTLNSSAFVSGNNVLAVEIHQSDASSSDLSFNLKLDATSATVCPIPNSLTSASITASSASISWAAVTGATSYNIRYRVVGSSTWTSTTSITTTKSLTGLASGSGYEFQVQAVCASSGSYSASANFTTTAAQSSVFVAGNSSWKYLDNGSNQGTTWRSVSFDDTAWATGTAEFGYGDGDETTLVNYGPNASSKYITTYFRKSFQVANPADYATLKLDVVRDDGAIVYINGTEVYRSNMPTGTIAYNTLAGGSIGSETAWNSTNVNANLLLAGTNVIAVEVHQNTASSTDVSFNARLYTSGATPITVTRGAYLQKLTPNSVTVRWRTDIACDSKVQFGTSTTYDGFVTDATSTTEHIVTLTGLTPGTKYYYSIGTSAQALQGDEKNNFYTAPTPDSTAPFRIWAIGDFGHGTTTQIDVRNAFTTYAGTTPTNLWIWLGDDAYENGTDAEFQSKVFAKYPDQFKSIPLFPSPGNHDYAQAGYKSSNALTTNFPYFSIFSVPQNGESGGVASNSPKYYSFDYGNVHFISLDSYGALNNSGSAMHTWLTNDLAANTKRWTVVYLHHPPYTKGSHNSDTASESKDIRTNIVPLLENYKVDLVLSGHSHNNERSYLIKGHLGIATTFTPSMKVSNETNNFIKTPPYDGTIYAVCGTAGETESGTQPGYPMACMFYNNTSYACSLVIDVAGDNLSCKYLASTGAIVDQFTITKSAAQKTMQEEQRAFDIALAQNVMKVNYTLEADSNVKMALYDLLGQHIVSFNRVPSFHPKGTYNVEIPLSELQLADGFYLVQMTINGTPFTRKVYLGS